jgi:CRISPR-associated protein Cas6
VGSAQVRELLPWGTLYAHLVAADGAADELEFLRDVDAQLQTLGVRGRAICGRRQVLAADDLQGFSLMVDGLSAQDSLCLLQAGLGRHRRLGCGLFVPHKSAAAVGAPP